MEDIRKGIQLEIGLSEEQIRKTNRKFKNATLMEDMKFRKVCESKAAIQEILRTVLKDEKLVVLKTLKQAVEEEPIFHGVILDCKCRLKTKEIVNIEVQTTNSDDAERRMRYNASILTIENSPKSKLFKYKYIPNIISIMFCEYDVFGKKKAIYEIDRVVRDTNKISNNGIREIYVNVFAKTADEKLKSLFNIMTTVNDIDEKDFPKLSERKEEVNNMDIGGSNMAGLDLMLYKYGMKNGKRAGREEGVQQGMRQGMQQGMQQGMRQGKISAFVEMVKNNLLSINVAAKSLNMSESEFTSLIK